MVQVSLSIKDMVLLVESPYNPKFVSRAHNLAGKWDSVRKVWKFDARDLDRVRKLCLDVYGDDGSTVHTDLFVMRAKALVDIKVAWDESIFLGAHQIVRSMSGDLNLGEGVILIKGSLRGRTVAAGSVIEIKDMTSHQVKLARLSAKKSGNWKVTAKKMDKMERLDALYAK